MNKNILQMLSAPVCVWAMLCVLTILSFAIFEGHILGPLSSLLIVGIAAFKARLVILHFMEAGHAPPPWRFLYETWNFLAAAIIVVGHGMVLQRVL